MKDFATLRFLDAFQELFRKMGIDYRVMRRILQTKLVMDRRRMPIIFNQSRKKKNTDKEVNYFIRSLWMYALFGLILVPFVIMGKLYLFQMTLVFAMLMFLVMTSMISDFSSVLLDIRDKTIISTKPVASQTVSMAKTLHICIYLFFLTVSITAIPLIAGGMAHGVSFFLIFAAEILLADLLIVFLTALLYFLILKFFDGEKLKDIINYVQIGLSISMFIGYQVVIRTFDLVNLHIAFKPSWWSYLLPPVWFGAPFAWLLNGQGSTAVMILSLMVMILPIVCILVYVRLMPSFERNLQKLSEEGTGHQKSRRGKKQIWVNLICWNKEERSYFRFASRMMNQERLFKLKVYPSLGFSIVIPFIFLFNEVHLKSLSALSSSRWYLAIYSSMVVIPTVFMMLKYSGTYKGAWIFKTTPIKDMSFYYKGTFKAAVTRLFLPVYVLESLIFIVIFGPRIIPQLVAALLASFIYAQICFKACVVSVPFSESFSSLQQGNGGKVLLLIFLISTFAAVHLISTKFTYGVYVYMVVLILANGLAWKFAFNKPLAKVTQS